MNDLRTHSQVRVDQCLRCTGDGFFAALISMAGCGHNEPLG